MKKEVHKHKKRQQLLPARTQTNLGFEIRVRVEASANGLVRHDVPKLIREIGYGNLEFFLGKR